MKRVILDTDIGTDSDDIGALMVMHNFAKEGKVSPLCVTSCTSRRDGAAAADTINRWYGRILPVGQWKKPFHEGPEHGCYSRALSLCFESDYTKSDAPDAVLILRKALNGIREKATLITVGPLNVVAALLKSGPCESSPLYGTELVENKVESVYIMGGRFDGRVPEWNIKSDVASAKTVVETLPVPAYFCPFEAGVRFKTGENALSGPFSPMKLGYYIHNGGVRESWDPLTTYVACGGEGLEFTDPGKVEIDAEGVTTFIEGGGKFRIMKPDFDVEIIRRRVENYMKP